MKQETNNSEALYARQFEGEQKERCDPGTASNEVNELVAARPRPGG